jgi:aminopeptidase N
MYYKGGNMLHTIRQLVGNDEKWRAILRGLNKTFWHQTVTGAQVEDYISAQAGIDLSKVFAQYLTTTRIPVLEYSTRGHTLTYRWSNVVPGFDMPVRVTLADSSWSLITPTTTPKTARLTLRNPASFRVDSNFYVTAHRTGARP